VLKLLDVYLIQRKTTMQAVRALGYSLARKEGKVFEKISEILGSLLFEGTELGSADVSVTLKRNGTSVAHIDLRSEADGSSKIISAMVDEKFYPTIEPLLAQYKPDYQQVYDFSNVAQGGWITD
jgi:hypothetical protein